MECTPLGPVRVISVRVNANNASRTVEQIVGQKKEMHLMAFDYCIEELQRDMQSQQHAFDERIDRDQLEVLSGLLSQLEVLSGLCWIDTRGVQGIFVAARGHEGRGPS